MKRHAKSWICLLLALGLLISAAPAAAADKPVLLKVPICFSTALPGLGSTIKWIEDRIHIASSGSVRMKVYEPGKLIAPFEILESVSKGKVNAGYSISGYWEGKIPGASIFSTVPFGPETGETYADYTMTPKGLRREKIRGIFYPTIPHIEKTLKATLLDPTSSHRHAKDMDAYNRIQIYKRRMF